VILVDTSVWIDLLGRRPRWRPGEDTLAQMAVCPPILQEVLQGVRAPAAVERLTRELRALPCVGDPLVLEAFLEAGEIYRAGRGRGLTIRSSVDCLIASIALRERLPVFHYDRDFDAIAKFTGLRVVHALG